MGARVLRSPEPSRKSFRRQPSWIGCPHTEQRLPGVACSPGWGLVDGRARMQQDRAREGRFKTVQTAVIENDPKCLCHQIAGSTKKKGLKVGGVSSGKDQKHARLLAHRFRETTPLDVGLRTVAEGDEGTCRDAQVDTREKPGIQPIL